MVAEIPVTVQSLSDTLSLTCTESSMVEEVRGKVATAWSLHPLGFRLIMGTSVLADDEPIKDLVAKAEEEDVLLTLVKLDPLLGLGQFDISKHRGVSTKEAGPYRQKLEKTSNGPDSNNVMLAHSIRDACFVEFLVISTRDEMSIGVTDNPQRAETASGLSNIRMGGTWIYSRRYRGSMPALLLNGARDATVKGYGDGDLIAAYVDPDQRLVQFFRNKELVASNLPDHPLPELTEETTLRFYVMVDETHDELDIARFGPGEPYPPQ